MKNIYKKQDAEGNNLPIEIGKGRNKEHFKVLKKYGIISNPSNLIIRTPLQLKKDFSKSCDFSGEKSMSIKIKSMMINHIQDQIKKGLKL
jgi:hypothetical protein